MSASQPIKSIIVGGGLAGSLLAVYLGERGHAVEVHELREDLRKGGVAGGRSINLALSHRGIEALRAVNLADAVLEKAVPMRGRMIHSIDGAVHFQPYGKDETQVIYSVSRSGLNCTLLDAAERALDVRLMFQHKCMDVDLEAPSASFLNLKSFEVEPAHGDVIFSADGAFSAVRAVMQKQAGFDYSQQYESYGYKELTIPAAEGGGFRLEGNALHIWPRKSFMMIALPNADGSYTCTLFWPYDGPDSFANIRSETELLEFFRRQFPDALPHMPTLVADYFQHPIGSLVTVRCGPWYWRDRVALLGDAAHAVVPFYGQGMNAAFEDVMVLVEMLDRFPADRERALREFYTCRKPDADALAHLALGNFVEMRDHTRSRAFLWKKRGEKWIHKLLPHWYLPLYTMVTFTRIPYAQAVARARRQNTIVLGVLIVLLVVFIALVLKTWT